MSFVFDRQRPELQTATSEMSGASMIVQLWEFSKKAAVAIGKVSLLVTITAVGGIIGALVALIAVYSGGDEFGLMVPFGAMAGLISGLVVALVVIRMISID